jgi:hypothetical protein
MIDHHGKETLASSSQVKKRHLAGSTLTTLFASTNAGDPGGGIYFDLTASSCVKITGWDFNTKLKYYNGVPITTVMGYLYSRPGSASSFQTNTDGWTQVGSGYPTTNAGDDNPTNFDFGKFVIQAGDTIGFAFTTDSTQLKYTDVTQDFFDDGTLRLDDQGANNVPFSISFLYTPRMVNTNIHYCDCTTPREDVDAACPCDSEWKNHGKYVSCVTKATSLLVNDGSITEEEKDAIVGERDKSDCGKERNIRG